MSSRVCGFRMVIPTNVTLRKYGLTEERYAFLWRLQSGLCGLCNAPLEGKRVNIDHQHVRGWKKMSSDRRRTYIRALLHARCNRFLLGPTFYGFKAEHFRMAADYLDRHS